MLRFRLLLFFAVILTTSLGGVARDLDEDGLEDQWEMTYFQDLDQAGDDDPDADGLSNAEEQDLGTNPVSADTDEDGLQDGDEVTGNPATDPRRADTDGDGLNDGQEGELGTDPTDTDSDNDQLSDAQDVQAGLDPLNSDTDGGGILDGVELITDQTDPLNPRDDRLDTDNDGLFDYIEQVDGTDPNDPDTDGDGLLDGEEDVNLNGSVDADETDPRREDSDDDGLLDGLERGLQGDPLDPDTDDDGLLDGLEAELNGGLCRGRLCEDSCPRLDVVDSDFDGLLDGAERAVEPFSDPCQPDTDGGGVLDVAERHEGSDPTQPDDDAALDRDGDGLSDGYELMIGSSPDIADEDGDGIDDAEEILPLSDRATSDWTDADSDDDGILDGNEGALGCDPGSADTDEDLIPDGVEVGLVVPQVSPLAPDSTSMEVFRPDLDPATTTFCFTVDYDADWIGDGYEDTNRNGRLDPGETSAVSFDTDGDGLQDWFEVHYSASEACQAAGIILDPRNAEDADDDPDEDGLTNLQEYGGMCVLYDPRPLDRRVRGLDYGTGDYIPFSVPTNPCLADTDGDSIDDFTEHQSSYEADRVPQSLRGCEFRSDPTTADSDDDGLSDGEEDTNGDGRWQPELGETHPLLYDTDGDILSDYHEGIRQTDPLNPDTDGDGLFDYAELSQHRCSPINRDTDGDGLPDGLEVGLIDDEDPDTTTNPSLADTDGDGLDDGVEDRNQNGRVDPGETDPGVADSDGDGLGDGVELGLVEGSDPNRQTDPFVKDTDGDGLWDGVEDSNYNGTTDEGESDPTILDTDGGGIEDGEEVLEDQTNPADGRDDHGLDADEDGLENSIEQRHGLNILNPDSDGDTIGDLVELGNPEAPDDSDGDGILDALDFDSDGDKIQDLHEAGSPPPVDSDGDGVPDYKDLDSDGDGVPDREEAGDLNLVTPPPDSDGDGRSDAQQVDADGDGLNDKDERTEGTDPTNADTDGGGVRDSVEVQRGSDPLDPDDDFKGWLEEGGSVAGGCGCATSAGGYWESLLLLVVLLLRRRRTLVALALFLSAMAAEARVHPDASQTAFDVNRLLPRPDGGGLVALGGTDLPRHMEFELGLWLEGIDHPLVVRAADKTVRSLVAYRLTTGVQLGVGLFDTMSMAARVPLVLAQGGDFPGQNMGALVGNGLGDLEFLGRWQIWDARGGRPGITFEGIYRLASGSEDAFLGRNETSGAVAATAEWRAGLIRGLGQYAYLREPERSLFNARFGDQHRVGFGLGYVLPGMGAEVGVEWVNWLGGEPNYSSEVLLGYRMRGPGFTMPLSLGAALTGTPRTPRFRGSAGALIRRRAN
ncbi:MAG: hypothetical protein CMH58_05660 [Myxococcales bacterium]|nr:hypothetical protein [Myxococcales bacterium]